MHVTIKKKYWKGEMLMKKLVLCSCGSKKPLFQCCQSSSTRVFVQQFSKPYERKQMMRKIKVSAEFGMRYRGLLHFYGNDLIAYKLELPKSRRRNNFLEILSSYFTEYLEDACPTSWQECQLPFWEEFLFIHYPNYIKLTPDEKEVERFIKQLIKFTRWLDFRVGTEIYPLIIPLVNNSIIELKKCEKYINKLFLHTYPDYYSDHWDPLQNIKYHNEYFEQFDTRSQVLFEITSITGPIFTAIDLDTNLSFQIIGLPVEMTVGTIINGFLAKRNTDWIWTWDSPVGVFPIQAKKYLKEVILS